MKRNVYVVLYYRIMSQNNPTLVSHLVNTYSKKIQWKGDDSAMFNSMVLCHVCWPQWFPFRGRRPQFLALCSPPSASGSLRATAVVFLPGHVTFSWAAALCGAGTRIWGTARPCRWRAWQARVWCPRMRRWTRSRSMTCKHPAVIFNTSDLIILLCKVLADQGASRPSRESWNKHYKVIK